MLTRSNALLEIYVVRSIQEPNKCHKCFLHDGLLFSDSVYQVSFLVIFGSCTEVFS